MHICTWQSDRAFVVRWLRTRVHRWIPASQKQPAQNQSNQNDGNKSNHDWSDAGVFVDSISFFFHTQFRCIKKPRRIHSLP